MLKSKKTINKPFGQRLTTGKANQRFKGTIKTMFHLAACSEQSRGDIKSA